MYIKPKKSLGQHFLTDSVILSKIVDAVPARKNHRIIELGAGTGALTEALMETFDDVHAIELDSRAVNILRKKFPGHSVHKANMLKINWNDFSIGKKKTHVVGNLPYHITSPVLFSLLENRNLMCDTVLMMQKEVAERLAAPIRTKDYGILSVQVQLMSSPELLFTVPRRCFTPPPKVESAVVRLKFDKGNLQCSDEHLKTVVRTAFNQRRKKLSNALAGLIEKEKQPKAYNFSKRAEAWPPVMYEKLTATLEANGILT
jgi:16S rRNA (adenine1518-N6/adenine1519-N6)-dimethyltransferase